jgi:hypothetical protein
VVDRCERRRQTEKCPLERGEDEEEIHGRGRALVGGGDVSVVLGTDGMRVVCVLLYLLCGG